MGAGERLSICGQFAIGRSGQWRALDKQAQVYKEPEFQGIDNQGRAIQFAANPWSAHGPAPSRVRVPRMPSSVTHLTSYVPNID